MNRCNDHDRQTDVHDITGPRILFTEPPQNSIIGITLGKAGRIVRLYGKADGKRIGVLPENLIDEAPHVDETDTVRYRSSRVGHNYFQDVIKLEPAPTEYIMKIKEEFDLVTWLSDAEKYVDYDGVTAREAIVMAVADDIDTVGSGQAKRIGDITGWGEEMTQLILERLCMSKQRRCRKEQGEINDSDVEFRPATYVWDSDDEE